MKALIIIISICLVLLFFVLVYLYKRKLTQLRDNTPFTSYLGRQKIKEYNRQLDFINGYVYFNRLKKNLNELFARR